MDPQSWLAYSGFSERPISERNAITAWGRVHSFLKQVSFTKKYSGINRTSRSNVLLKSFLHLYRTWLRNVSKEEGLFMDIFLSSTPWNVKAPCRETFFKIPRTSTHHIKNKKQIFFMGMNVFLFVYVQIFVPCSFPLTVERTVERNPLCPVLNPST